MGAQVTKCPTGCNNYVVKKGKARIIKRPVGYKRPSTSSYVRPSDKPRQTRHSNAKDRVRPTMTIPELLYMPTSTLKKKLMRMKLVHHKNKRCLSRQCFCSRNVRNGPTIFAEDVQAHTLTTRALIAYSAIVGMKSHLCFDVNHKSVERVYQNLYSMLASKVRSTTHRTEHDHIQSNPQLR
eukprot:3146440-Amphidinium_carterae.1